MSSDKIDDRDRELMAMSVAQQHGDAVRATNPVPDELAQLRAERDALKAIADSARERFGPAGYKILKEHAEFKAERDALKAELESLRADYDAVVDERDLLAAEVERLKGSKFNITMAQEELDGALNIKQQLDAARVETERLRKEVGSKASWATKLQSELQASRVENARLAAQINDLGIIAAGFKRELSQYKAERDLYRVESARLLEALAEGSCCSTAFLSDRAGNPQTHVRERCLRCQALASMPQSAELLEKVRWMEEALVKVEKDCVCNYTGECVACLCETAITHFHRMWGIDKKD